MNLLIIGYNNLADGFLYASKSLEKLNYIIFFFPYNIYINDSNKENILINFINDNCIDICLWWNNNVKFENYKNIISSISNKNIKHIFFNWDPFLYNYQKYDSICWKEKIDEKELYYPLMNHVFSCFEKEINYFKNKIKISYLPPGFDKNISKYEYDKNYECDISIVCTNLYNNTNEFPDSSTNITRYEIVNKLYENREKINFHIYGPDFLKDLYPECYKGFIDYNNCYKVFSNSKINLSIHPMIYELNEKNSNEEYFSERLPQILGCKGLLVTNTLFNNPLFNNPLFNNSLSNNKLIPNKDYIYINSNNYYDIFLYIIKNNKSFDIIRENGYKKALLNYQWDHWGKKIDNILRNNINILILNITTDWVYKLYNEYIYSIKEFISNNYYNTNIKIIYYDINLFNINNLKELNLNFYHKIFYSGNIDIFKELINNIEYKSNKIYFINIEQMSHPSYYKLIREIDNKINIIDYSEENIPFFKNIYNVYLFPPYFKNIYNNKKEIDVLSLINNEYREKILNNLKLHNNLNVIFLNNCYGEIRDEYFSKTKVYVNIHCSENHNTMELIRIVNLIFNKVIVISQKTIFPELIFLKKYIIICNNLNDLSNYIMEILNNYDYYYHKIYNQFVENDYYNYIKKNIEKIIYG